MKSDRVTLSRWRHGFEPRWDYKREPAGQPRDVPSGTHRFALVDFLNAYDTFSRVGETEALKVVVSPLVGPQNWEASHQFASAVRRAKASPWSHRSVSNE